jgi:hypothetical protein
MMAITTRSSTNVNAERRLGLVIRIDWTSGRTWAEFDYIGTTFRRL